VTGDRAPLAPREREAQRLEAFSDGVLAVIITLMALELHEPTGAGWRDLGKVVPSLLIYALSFTFVGIYWNNHHHLLRATERISGFVMLSNLLLLFWISLIPFVTKWVGDFNQAHLPASAYGAVAMGAAISFSILVRAIIGCNGTTSGVARAIGSDVKGKLSVVLYVAGVGLAWVSPWIAYSIYAAVALMWFIPDRRLEREESAA
jgi:uncharacterized membrane protein